MYFSTASKNRSWNQNVLAKRSLHRIQTRSELLKFLRRRTESSPIHFKRFLSATPVFRRARETPRERGKQFSSPTLNSLFIGALSSKCGFRPAAAIAWSHKLTLQDSVHDVLYETNGLTQSRNADGLNGITLHVCKFLVTFTCLG